MMAVELPEELREAIERRAGEIGPRELARASEELSAQLRSPTRPASPIVRSRSQVLAYAVYRVPATYAAATAAFLAIREQRPSWQPRSMLDVGAGLRTGMWAATSAWPSLETLTALDAVPRMIDLGRELGRFAPHRAVEAATWVRAEVPADLPRGPYDLVVLSYVLTELSPAAIPETVRRAWEATAGTLVLIMPGTPAGYAKILLARAQLLGNGGHVVAPCPHDSACPMIGEDWCHFAVRLPRSQLHKSAKQGVLGFEDEKFSYVGVSREPGHRATARVVRHPQIRPGHVTLELCAREGLRTLTVTKRHKDAFRHARKSAWGDSYDAAVLGMAIETKREARRGLSTLEDDQDVGGD